MVRDVIRFVLYFKNYHFYCRFAFCQGACPPHSINKTRRCWSIKERCYCGIANQVFKLSTRCGLFQLKFFRMPSLLWFYKHKKSWWTALHFCRQYGMELLSLETKQEAVDLWKGLRERDELGSLTVIIAHYNFEFYTPKPSTGFSAFDYLTSGTLLHGDRKSWIWAGSGVLQNRTIPWSPNEPSGFYYSIKEDCLNVKISKEKESWNDLNCELHTRYFICEFEMVPKNFWNWFGQFVMKLLSIFILRIFIL